MAGPVRQGAGPNGPDGRNRKQTLEGADGAATDTSTLRESGGVVGRGDEMPQNNESTENSDLIKTPKRNSEGGTGLIKRGFLLLTSPLAGMFTIGKSGEAGDRREAQEGAATAGTKEGGTEGAGDRGIEAEDTTAAGSTENGTGRVNDRSAAEGNGASRADRDSTNEHVDIYEKVPRANCG